MKIASLNHPIRNYYYSTPNVMKKNIIFLFFGILSCFTTDAQEPKDSIEKGTLIVLNKSEGTASLINLEDGKVKATIPTGEGPHEVAISKDGKTAVVTNYGANTAGTTLTVIDIAGKKATKTISLENYKRPHGIEFMQDNQVLVTAEDNKALLIVDVASGEIVSNISTGQSGSHMVAFSPKHDMAFVPNMGSGSVSIIDLNKGQLMKNIKTGAGAEGIAIAPAQKELWVTNRENNTISVININTLEISEELKSKDFPIRIKFTPDGKYALVSNARSGDVKVFSAGKKELIHTISMSISEEELKEGGLLGNEFENSPVPVGILINPSGKFAYVANTNADIITVIDLKNFEIVSRLKAGQEPDGMGYSAIELK